MSLNIGLFGTCGSSTWRNRFINTYNELGYQYFNPQKDDWCEEDAQIEAEHLASDQIILFPVTSETYATGSLSEVGFSILSAIKLNDQRSIVVFVDQSLDDNLKSDSVAYKESTRARALIVQHLKKIALANVYLVDSLEQMLDVSVQLYKLHKILDGLSQFSSSHL